MGELVLILALAGLMIWGVPATRKFFQAMGPLPPRPYPRQPKNIKEAGEQGRK